MNVIWSELLHFAQMHDVGADPLYHTMTGFAHPKLGVQRHIFGLQIYTNGIEPKRRINATSGEQFLTISPLYP